MQLEEVTLVELQTALSTGEITARQLTEMYIERIQALDQSGPTLNAVLEINPDALEIASALDQERATSGPRGPLHGIPVLIKDNIATADKMQTTAGILALLNARVPRDAFVVQKLREAGAVILGKANLSEWANIRSDASPSGWSARGGIARNPYVLDRSTCGSSAGSASAIAANLAAVSLGTETDGSILCPAGMNGVVGIKPTVGLTSRAGVIPISYSQDSVGPFGRTVTDAAIVLGAITGIDVQDPATQASAEHLNIDYTKYLDPDGLRGARIGICREIYSGYSAKADALINAALKKMEELGAIIVDPANIPSARQIAESTAEMEVMLFELKAGMNTYLSTLEGAQVQTLADIIAFNETHAAEELHYLDRKTSYAQRRQLTCMIRAT